MDITLLDLIEALQSIKWPAASFLIVYIFREEIKNYIKARYKKILHTLNGDSHEERIEKIEENDIQHLEADVRDLREGQKDLKAGQQKIENIARNNKTDIAVLKSQVDDLREK